jgi:hypothetical protein
MSIPVVLENSPRPMSAKRSLPPALLALLAALRGSSGKFVRRVTIDPRT